MLKYLICPQCKARRFFVKNAQGERVVVQFREDGSPDVISPEGATTLNFEEEELFCLGCSWTGSLQKLKNFFRKK